MNRLLIQLNVFTTSRPIYQESSSLIFYCHILESTSCMPSKMIFDVILAFCEIFFPLHDILHQLNIDYVTCQTRNPDSLDSRRPTYFEILQYRKYWISSETVWPTCQVQFMKETLKMTQTKFSMAVPFMAANRKNIPCPLCRKTV